MWHIAMRGVRPDLDSAAFEENIQSIRERAGWAGIDDEFTDCCVHAADCCVCRLSVGENPIVRREPESALRQKEQT
jgi:hypothetical protein